MRAGIDRFGFAEREAVERSRRELRLESATAAEILDSVARRAFLAFVSRSRTKSNRLDSAKELKALVYFSNIVVAPLLEDLKVRVRAFFPFQGSARVFRGILLLHVPSSARNLVGGSSMRRFSYTPFPVPAAAGVLGTQRLAWVLGVVKLL